METWQCIVVPCPVILLRNAVGQGEVNIFYVRTVEHHIREAPHIGSPYHSCKGWNVIECTFTNISDCPRQSHISQLSILERPSTDGGKRTRQIEVLNACILESMIADNLDAIGQNDALDLATTIERTRLVALAAAQFVVVTSGNTLHIIVVVTNLHVLLDDSNTIGRKSQLIPTSNLGIVVDDFILDAVDDCRLHNWYWRILTANIVRQVCVSKILNAAEWDHKGHILLVVIFINLFPVVGIVNPGSNGMTSLRSDEVIICATCCYRATATISNQCSRCMRLQTILESIAPSDKACSVCLAVHLELKTNLRTCRNILVTSIGNDCAHHEVVASIDDILVLLVADKHLGDNQVVTSHNRSELIRVVCRS